MSEFPSQLSEISEWLDGLGEDQTADTVRHLEQSIQRILLEICFHI